MMNNFAWAAIMLFRISGASQAYFGRFKGCYQRGYYCRERLYSQISLKVWDSEEKLAFSSRLPLRRHIARLGTFSVDPGIVVSFYASAHHPQTTLAIDEWVIFWPREDSPVEVGLTECSRHLVSSHHQQPYNLTTSNTKGIRWNISFHQAETRSLSCYQFSSQSTASLSLPHPSLFTSHFSTYLLLKLPLFSTPIPPPLGCGILFPTISNTWTQFPF